MPVLASVMRGIFTGVIAAKDASAKLVSVFIKNNQVSARFSKFVNTFAKVFNNQFIKRVQNRFVQSGKLNQEFLKRFDNVFSHVNRSVDNSKAVVSGSGAVTKFMVKNDKIVPFIQSKTPLTHKHLFYWSVGTVALDIFVEELLSATKQTKETQASAVVISTQPGNRPSDDIVDVIGSIVDTSQRVLHFFDNSVSIRLLLQQLTSLSVNVDVINNGFGKVEALLLEDGNLAITVYYNGIFSKKDANAPRSTKIILVDDNNRDDVSQFLESFTSKNFSFNDVSKYGRVSPLLAAVIMYILCGGNSAAAVLGLLCTARTSASDLPHILSHICFFENDDDNLNSLGWAALSFVNGMPLGVICFNTLGAPRVELVTLDNLAPFGLEVPSEYSDWLKQPLSFDNNNNNNISMLQPTQHFIGKPYDGLTIKHKSNTDAIIPSYNNHSLVYDQVPQEDEPQCVYTKRNNSVIADNYSGTVISRDSVLSLIDAIFGFNEINPKNYKDNFIGVVDNTTTVIKNSILDTEGKLVISYSGKFLDSSVDFRCKGFLSIKDLPMLRSLRRSTRLSYHQLLFLMNLPLTESLIEGVINEQS